MHRLSFCFFCLFLITCFTKGQSTCHVGFFPAIDHSGSLSNRLEYSLYYFGAFNIINSRLNNAAQNPGLFVLYAEHALTYKLNSQLSFTGSYVFERQNPAKSNYRNENRFYIQSAFRQKAGLVNIKHRLRFDGRFIQDQLTKKKSVFLPLALPPGVSIAPAKIKRQVLSDSI